MSFLSNMGTTEWIIIAIVLVVLFGSKKITELARGLGESGKELKKAKRELHTAIKEQDNDKEKKEDK